MSYAFPGHCPVCDFTVTFTSEDDDFRDHLKCPRCEEGLNGSLVRERALMKAIELFGVKLDGADVHEFGSSPRGASLRLRELSHAYTETHYWPDRAAGEIINGIRNENAERQTFDNVSFDLVVSMDVMEHVNCPDRVVAEVYRTLRWGGFYVFTAPVYPDIMVSRRVGLFREDGVIEHLEAKPEYHDNPINPRGSLVTWRFGYDFPQRLRSWAPFDVYAMRFEAPGIGAMGWFSDVFVCAKGQPPETPQWTEAP